MRTYDWTPLLRSTVGYDRLFSELAETAAKLETGGYPPYNIERLGEDVYHITIAVAGFGADDIEIEVTDRDVRVWGRKSQDPEPQREFIHQGIAGRNFERRFRMAEHMQVDSAQLEHGLLTIVLRIEIPEAMKPRRVEIGARPVAPTVLKTHAAG